MTLEKPDPNALMTVVIFPEGTKFEVKTGTEAEMAPLIHKTLPAFRFVFDGLPLDVKVAMHVVRHPANPAPAAAEPAKAKKRRTDAEIQAALAGVDIVFSETVPDTTTGHRPRPSGYKSGSPEALRWTLLDRQATAK